MEAIEGLSLGGVTVKGEEAPDGFRVAPRSENSNPNPNLNPDPNPNSTPDVPNVPNPTLFGGSPAGTVSLAVGSVGGGTGTGTGTDVVKKKRGRPRKYRPDGTLAVTALSPMPISASIPLTGEFSTWKRGRGRPVDSVKKQYKYEYETPGDKIAYFVGANFTPHLLTVNAGEDVTMKIMSFAQQGARAICILSANGTISNVTLRQPTSSGGTLTYEGRFEILSLSGSFMPTENGGTKSRSGGMSVSLAGPDGRVVGGGLAGLLVAAGPVQVVVGSFLPGHQQEQKHKKQRVEPAPIVTPTSVTVLSAEDLRGGFGAVRPVLIPAASLHGDHSKSLNPVHAFHNPAVDNITSSADDDSRGPESNCEVSC